MAQAGFTPLQLYYSTTAAALPLSANLIPGELALNTADGKLFFKNSSGVVSVLADSGIATGNLPGGSAGSVVFQSAPGTTAYLSIGATGYILTSTGTAPTYSNPASITVGHSNEATTATNLADGGANRIPYQTGVGATSFVAAPVTTNHVLTWTGSSIGWASVPSVTSTGNLVGGTAGAMPYQTAPNLTSFTGVGTTGQVLTSNGTGAPTWNTLDALPNQAGQAGKYLTTDGSVASWQNTGASAAGVIWENSLVISDDYTLTTGKNGMSVGPITIDSGVTVTVPSGQRWVVL